MKRDMDLIRDILLQIEASDSDPLECIELKIQGRTDLEISYHLMLLKEAGLIEAIDFSADDNTDFQAQSLTWTGHEFLDTARDNTVWNRARKEIGSNVSSVSLNLLTEKLTTIIKDMTDM